MANDDPHKATPRRAAARRRLGVVLAWLASARIVGIAISLTVHSTLAVVAALVLTGAGDGGGAGRADFGVAVISETQLSELPTGEVSLDSPSVDDASLDDLPAVEALDASIAADVAGIQDDVSTIVSGLTGSGGKDAGAGGSMGGAGGGGAKFFGVEAQGSRFAYIVDRSGSMRGEKMERTKLELFESVHALLEHMSFSVVLFSSTGEAVFLGARSKWVEASDDGKRWAERNIRTIDSGGGTEPLEALQMVFDMTPRPDAIYLMTDGDFASPEIVIEQIARVNKGRHRIPIHCLAFGDQISPNGVETLQKIARDSGGTYAQVAAP